MSEWEFCELHDIWHRNTSPCPLCEIETMVNKYFCRDRVGDSAEQSVQSDEALLSCWTIESAKDKDVARKVKLYIRENWQELAELLDKYCIKIGE